MIEALICGAFPITCTDNETAKEFLPLDFMCKPNAESIIKHIKDLESNYKIRREMALKLGQEYKEKFNKTKIAMNILSILKWFMFLSAQFHQELKI